MWTPFALGAVSARCRVVTVVLWGIWGGVAVWGADRVVLCELFTRVSCAHCPEAGQALDRMLVDYPDSLAAIEYHITDAYQFDWGFDRGVDFYLIAGVPYAWFDGGNPFPGGTGDPNTQYGEYVQRYTQRMTVPTDVVLAAGAQPVPGEPQERWVNVRVAIEPGGVAKTMRLYMVQVLDHYPDDPPYSRNTAIQALDPEVVTVSPGDDVVVSRLVELSGDSWQRKPDVRLVVWVQEVAETRPAEVYQALTVYWPFPEDCNQNGVPDLEDIATGLEEDCNGNGRPDVCDIQDGTSTDEDQNGIPDECDVVRGDCDCSGAVNYFDINYFLAALNSEATWRAQYAAAHGGAEPPCPFDSCDANGDGEVDYFDINVFLSLLGT